MITIASRVNFDLKCETSNLNYVGINVHIVHFGGL